MSKIEWTEKSWNAVVGCSVVSPDASWTPIRARFLEIQNDGSGKERIGWHCEHVSEGCRNCYAEGMNIRLGTGLDFKPGNLFRQEKVGYCNGELKLFLDDKMLAQPYHWKRPRMVFVCSMTDLFADFVPDKWIDQVFAAMANCPQHVFQVLTKRSVRMRTYIDQAAGRIKERHHWERFDNDPSWPRWPLPNVWLGVSCEDQTRADERIPDLLGTPAAVRFVSAEPLLGPIDIRHFDLPGGYEEAYPLGAPPGIMFSEGDGPGPRLDWVICGGESGLGARPMHPDWARGLRDQCQAAQVPFFFKQWGKWRQATEEDERAGRAQIFGREGVVTMVAVGKKAAGRSLDGRTWDEMPGVRA